LPSHGALLGSPISMLLCFWSRGELVCCVSGLRPGVGFQLEIWAG
jgi:hypothetical protein